MLGVDIRNNGIPGINIVSLSGEFDLADQGHVEWLLSKMLSRDCKESCKGVIVDLSRVTHVEEAGIETLIQHLKKLTEIGAKMAIVVQPSSPLMKKLTRLGMLDSSIGLKAFKTIDEAEDALVRL